MEAEPHIVADFLTTKMARKHQDRVMGLVPLNPDRSSEEQEHRLIADMVQKGAGFDEVGYTLINGRHDSYFNALFDKSPRSARHWLTTHIAEVRAAMRLSLKMVRWITITPDRWKHQKGLSEKNVLFAHACRCYTSGTLVYSFSVREIAEAVEAELELVSRCNAVLCKHLIQHVSVGRGDNASTYRLNDVSRVPEITYPTIESRTDRSWGMREAREALFVRYKRTHGLFRNKPGLGSSAYEVWCVTHISDFTQSEIITRTGLSKGAVSKATIELTELGLLHKADGRYKAVSNPERIKRVADMLGASHEHEMQIERHKRDREIYKRTRQEHT